MYLTACQGVCLSVCPFPPTYIYYGKQELKAEINCKYI